jgi:UDP-galactopyranose mutase
MFENMLDHPRIKIVLNTDYREALGQLKCREIIFTGPIDSFFDFRFGKLPYRSIEFEHQTCDQEVFQEAPVMNYPNDYLYTRVTEFKYLTGQKHAKTSIVYEYPTAEGDPYYPIPRAENQELYQQYKELAAARRDVHFVGRLGTYKYYNMDQVVGQALTTARHLTNKPLAYVA